MQIKDKERLLTRQEVDERFGIPKRFLELSVNRGDGPPLVKVGRLVRYRVKDIEHWISTCVVDSTGSDRGVGQ